MRRWHLDGGPGNQHTLLFNEGKWFGWENLFLDLPRGPLRVRATRVLFEQILRGATQQGNYEIRELPDDEDQCAG